MISYSWRSWMFAGLIMIATNTTIQFAHVSIAEAHARLLSTGKIPPRNNNAGIKTGPCGGIARTATPAVLKAGETIQVQWQETINHPGRFEFYFSQANDQNFQLLLTVQDTQNTTNDLPHNYTANLTVPNTLCTTCTIQMIQVMTENPANPTNYYSCADIQVVANTPGTPTPTPSASATPVPATPTPMPEEDCH